METQAIMENIAIYEIGGRWVNIYKLVKLSA